LPIFDFRFPAFSRIRFQSKIKNRQSKMALSLRKLEAFPSALLSVLLTLFNSWISRHQPGVFEGRTQVAIELNQGSRDAVTDRAGLARWTTASDVDY
jgi:hypothetical protein